MAKRVIVAGLLGGFVVIVWTIVVNGIFGFKSSIDMKPIPDERGVYETLKSTITEPGRYILNPAVDSSGFYPANEPVFSVLYGGMGHEAAGMMALIQLPLAFVAPMIAAWMLSMTSTRVRSNRKRKVIFVTCIGLLLGASGMLDNFGIGGYPLESTLLLVGHDIVLWALVGLVLAWRIR